MHRHHFQPCAAGKQSHLDSIPAFNNLISLIFTQVQRFSHKNILWMIKRDLLSEQNKSTDKSWIKSPPHALHSHACANQCLSLSEPVTEYSRLPLDKSKPCKGGGSYHHSAPQSFFSTSFFCFVEKLTCKCCLETGPRGLPGQGGGRDHYTSLHKTCATKEINSLPLTMSCMHPSIKHTHFLSSSHTHI